MWKLMFSFEKYWSKQKILPFYNKYQNQKWTLSPELKLIIYDFC